MNAPDRIAADRQAVERLRKILSNMDTAHLKLQAMGGEMMLTCENGPGDYAELAVILPDASDAVRDFFLLGPSLALAAIRRNDRADAYFRRTREDPPPPPQPDPKPKKHGSECAMHCDKPAFRQFIAERYGADASDAQSVIDAVKKELRISSRSVLNHDAEAVDRWKDMRADFQGWLQT